MPIIILSNEDSDLDKGIFLQREDADMIRGEGLPSVCKPKLNVYQGYMRIVYECCDCFPGA